MSGASFDAGTVIEPLEWNFEKYGGGSGVIPEPTDRQFAQFQKSIKSLLESSGMMPLARAAAGGNINPADALKLMSEMPEGGLDKLNDQMVEIISVFTSNCPSAEQINRLPMRVRQAFMGWVMGQFGPKASPPATVREPAITVNGATPSLPGSISGFPGVSGMNFPGGSDGSTESN